jgi:ABC-2 type transport system ATP-binding protein
MLLDEPLSGLDPRGIRSTREAIRELAGEGTAVVISSHQLELIEVLADRILILHRGRRVFLGTLDEARALGGEVPLARSLEEIFLEATREPEVGTEADAT